MATDTTTSDTSTETTTDDGKGGASTDTGASTETDTGDGKDDDDPDEGDAAKWKGLARKHEKESKRRGAELEKITTATKTDADKAVEKARQEGRDEAAADALSSNVDTILDVVASAKLADPTYVRLIDADTREGFTDDGKVDRKAIEKAVGALVKAHPELAKDPSSALPGSKKSRESGGGFDMNEEIRRRAGR